jgi:hypothetical protein
MDNETPALKETNDGGNGGSAGREQDNLDVKAWRGLKLMLPLKKERMHVDRNGKRNAKFPGSKEAVEVVLCE